MQYKITGDDSFQIDPAPDTTAAEVIRNVSIIVSTTLGECPGWRSFGTNMNFLDKNILSARPLIIKEVIRAVEQWEPRAKVIDPVILHWDDAKGRLIPQLTIEVKES